LAFSGREYDLMMPTLPENVEGGAKFIRRRRINALCTPECATPTVRHTV